MRISHLSYTQTGAVLRTTPQHTMIQRLFDSHLTLHAELLDQMIPDSAAAVTEGAVSGSIVLKRLKAKVS